MDQLISLYQQRLNLQDAAFSRIDHDDAMVALVYEVTQSDGIQRILKICSRPGDYLREVYFLSHFANRLPVPRIIQVVQPESGIHGAVLMERLLGSVQKISGFSDVLAFEMGSLLAKIHLSRANGYGDLTQQEEMISDPCMYFSRKFEEGFAECRDHLPKALLEQCRGYYDAHLNLLSSGDGPCVVHRDFRPGNVIVYEGKLQGVIDWSAGRAGFAQEDFCSIEHGEWPTANKQSFLLGYASIRAIPEYRAMMPLLRLSKAIATIGFTVKRATWNGSHSQLYQFNRQFLETI